MAETDLIPLAAAVLHAGSEPERVLEIECGEGDGVLFLAREYPRARIRGVDPSEEAVRRVTRRIGLDPEGRVAVKVGGRRSLPFPDDHFDIVAQRRGRLGLAEIARVLRPGGCLIVAPSSPPGSSSRFPRQAWKTRPGSLDPHGRWSRRALSRRGFETVAVDDSFLVTRLRAAP